MLEVTYLSPDPLAPVQGLCKQLKGLIILLLILILLIILIMEEVKNLLSHQKVHQNLVVCMDILMVKLLIIQILVQLVVQPVLFQIIGQMILFSIVPKIPTYRSKTTVETCEGDGFPMTWCVRKQ